MSKVITREGRAVMRGKARQGLEEGSLSCLLPLCVVWSSVIIAGHQDHCLSEEWMEVSHISGL